MNYLKITLLSLATILLSNVAHTQDFQTMTNRWKTSQNINTSFGDITSSAVNPNEWSAQWTLVKIPGTKYSRIQSRHKPDHVIHAENGYLECSPMKMGAWSAQWSFERISGTNDYWEIINRWKPNQKIHVEKGPIQLGKIHDGAYSAQWKFEPAAGKSGSSANAQLSSTYSGSAAATVTTTTKQTPAATPAPSSNPYGAASSGNVNPYLNSANNSSSGSSNPYASSTNSNNASATATQDFYVTKGPVGKMYFRYTDQVSGGGGLELRVGSKIKVLPNQKLSSASTDMRGISFDPNNPKICGKVFTVQSMSPLTFLEEFPEMMRNTHNGSFGFKVEVIQY